MILQIGMVRIDDPKERKASELGVGASAFLGGIGFTAMIFVMQAKKDFTYQGIPFYPDILITCLAGISFAFIMACLTNIEVASRRESSKGKIAILGDHIVTFGFFAFVGIYRSYSCRLLFPDQS